MISSENCQIFSFEFNSFLFFCVEISAKLYKKRNSSIPQEEESDPPTGEIISLPFFSNFLQIKYPNKISGFESKLANKTAILLSFRNQSENFVPPYVEKNVTKSVDGEVQTFAAAGEWCLYFPNLNHVSFVAFTA